MNPSDELLDLLNDACDGKLDAAQRLRLERLVIDDPDARRHYLRFMTMHAMGELFAGRVDHGDVERLSAPLMQLPAFRLPEEPRRWVRIPALAAIRRYGSPGVLSAVVSGLFITCVLLLLALWTVPQWRNEAPFAGAERQEFTARLVRTYQADWAEPSEIDPHRATDLLVGQQLELLAGMAEIEFDSGAKVLLEGPARFQIQNADRLYLHRGKLVAEAPARAVGFTVETASATIVDLGTEFGVGVEDDGAVDVEVFNGVVELHWRQGETSQRLTAGQAGRIGTQGEFSPIAEKSVNFRRHFPGRDAAVLLYAQQFENEADSNQSLSSVDWQVRTTVNGMVSDQVNSALLGVAPRGYVFYAPQLARSAPHVRMAPDAPALAFTRALDGVDVAQLRQVFWTINTDNIDAEMRVALQIEGVWYASAQRFVDPRDNPGAAALFQARLFHPAEFVAAANWVEIENAAVGAAGPLRLGDAPGENLQGAVTGIGFYLRCGSEGSGGPGDHLRFDDVKILGASASPPRVSPRRRRMRRNAFLLL